MEVIPLEEIETENKFRYFIFIILLKMEED